LAPGDNVIKNTKFMNICNK